MASCVLVDTSVFIVVADVKRETASLVSLALGEEAEWHGVFSPRKRRRPSHVIVRGIIPSFSVPVLHASDAGDPH